MPDTKTIAVVGATGAQGGGLARAIMADPEKEFELRALTRNPSSEKAQEIAQIGGEIVQADIDDEASMRDAFDGAYGAFLMTNFWEHGDPEREKSQAGVMARAAAGAGVRHAIWSSLDDTRESVPLEDPRMPTLQGRYKVPHFDSKAEADGRFIEAGVPTTLLKTTFYWENFLTTFAPERDDGRLVLSIPIGESRLAGIAVVDIGRTALGIFKRGSEFVGRIVSVAGEHLTGEQFAETFSRVLGEDVAYRPRTIDEMRAAGFPGADDIANMFQYYIEFDDEITARRDVDLVRELNPSLQTFEAWLEAHRDAFTGD
ncbi:NmrA/HSCARG family protein [Glycomyces halotolerans]